VEFLPVTRKFYCRWHNFCLQLLAIYGLISLATLVAAALVVSGFIAVALVLIPIWQTKATLFRATVLDTAEPVLVIQDQGKVLLVNSGTATARFAVYLFCSSRV